jgi:L-serine/L-threonine ammonia-lyase
MHVQPLHTQTPILFSQHLKNTIGKSVYFKMEALQPTGSFKIRGIGRLCQHYAMAGKKQFVASSGGNAGIAVAYAGQQLDIPTTVFIPSTTHEIYIKEIKLYGANVVVAGDVWDEAHQAASSFAVEHDAAYIPPFDHPLLWAGHASMLYEVAETGFCPDVIIAAVGGGGLACGLLEGMHQQSWTDVPLIAVETAGADSFSQSIKANQLMTLPKITSKATSLGAKRITPALWAWREKHKIESVVVTDEAAEAGARAFAQDKRILVELSAGAALSIVYDNHPIIEPYESILVIVCGGVGTFFF